jgi:hypothetical protein
MIVPREHQGEGKCKLGRQYRGENDGNMLHGSGSLGKHGQIVATGAP